MKDLLDVKKSLQPEFKKYLEEQKKRHPESIVYIQGMVEDYCEYDATTVKQQKEFLKKLNGKKGDDFMHHLCGQGYGML